MVVYPLGHIFKRFFVQNDTKGSDIMGGTLRLYVMPEGILVGFYRELGGYVMVAKIPGTDKVVYAYANPEDDYRFELIAAVRSPKSLAGREDAVLIKDRRSGAVRTTKAEFLGVAHEVGQNRYMIGRPTLTVEQQNRYL